MTLDLKQFTVFSNPGWAGQVAIPPTFVKFPINPQEGLTRPLLNTHPYLGRPRLYQLSQAALRVRVEE